ncbi:DUF2125 domain-containing protein [Niveispirillum fermenti]|uniref:DUF2125 domain-containing protein n=1 Tax=Niveispirillum fermenti TaxID=1233113 RepID=UPI003A8A0B49
MLRRYRPLFLALSVAILLLLAYTAFWATAAGRLRTALATAPEQALAGQGVVLALGDPVVEGFPLHLTVRLAGMRAQWPSGTVVESGPLELTAWAWAPSDIKLAGKGPVRLDLAGSSRHAPVAGQAAGLTGALMLGTGGQIRSATLMLEQPHTAAAGDLGPLAAAAATVTWTAPLRAPAGPTDPQGRTSLLILGLDLPGAVPAPLGRRVDQIALSFEPRGPLPAGPGAAGLAAWRDGGGTLEILALRLLWSGIDMRMEGTLALDRTLQPEGAGTAELSGSDALVDMMVRNGSLEAGQGDAVKAALGMMARRTVDGRHAVAVPVSLQESKLFIGPIPVATVPPLSWD